MSDQTTEILLLPDGRLYVHNLTPKMAELLATLDPEDAEMRQRANPGCPGATLVSKTLPAATSS